MAQLPERRNNGTIEQKAEGGDALSAKVEMIATGVVTGVVATVIVQAGRGIIGTLAKNPLVAFGFGIAAGVLSAKYRKELATLSNQAAVQGKGFALRQKQEIKNMLATSHQDVENPGA